ncbi:MAG: YcxB family protein [Gemmataceae bacterium]|nr:YcxB family protein [Gemmataceae bacterium]
MEPGFLKNPPPAPAEGALVVEFTLTFDDHVAFGIHCWDQSQKLGGYGERLWAALAAYWGAIGVTGVIALLLITVLFDSVPRGQEMTVGLPIALVVVGFLLLTWFLIVGFGPRGLVRLLSRADQLERVRGEVQAQLQCEVIRIPEHHRLTITPDGISEITEYHRSTGGLERATHTAARVTWDAVAMIDTTADHLFFRLFDHSTLIIPARAFPDEKEFLRFVHTALAYRASFTLVGEVGKGRPRAGGADAPLAPGD